MSKFCEDGSPPLDSWKSNFSLCQDENYFSQTIKASGKQDFSPHSQPPVKPARPPVPANFMHCDVRTFNDVTSVTKSTFTPKTSSISAAAHNNHTTNWKMHGDVRKIQCYKPLQKEEFLPRYYSWRKPNTHVDTVKENVLTGDREKIRSWTSEAKESFVSPGSSCNRAGVERRLGNLYDRSVIGKGDIRLTRYQSLHKNDFKQHRLPSTNNIDYYKLHSSHVPTGDREKMNTRESEQQSGYKPHSVSHVTNTHDTKVAVYNKLFRSNIRGDMRLSDGSTTLHKECFRNHTRPVERMNGYDRNQCNVPKGDLDYKRGLMRVTGSIQKDHFIPYRYVGHPVSRHSSKMTHSDVTFGRRTYWEEGSQQKSDFVPKHVNKVKLCPPPKDNINLGYYKGFMPNPVGSLTSEDFVEHRAAKPDNQQLSEALQKCHIAPPSGEKLNYESSNRRDFYSRERSRREPINNELQTSSCPIGTLGRFVKGSNVATTGCQPPWVSEMKDSHRNYGVVRNMC